MEWFTVCDPTPEEGTEALVIDDSGELTLAAFVRGEWIDNNSEGYFFGCSLGDIEFWTPIIKPQYTQEDLKLISDLSNEIAQISLEIRNRKGVIGTLEAQKQGYEKELVELRKQFSNKVNNAKD